ncbi:MAG: NF038122 family metalloprotease, partial [Acidobacteria bacterium]|nr:NF038122 family metalloprotease [Acidobacteriota bacterium]
FIPTNTGNGAVITMSRTLARNLGIPVTTSPVNDATIGFNSVFQFDFDPDDGIETGKTDFVAVAAHEIGHALGFISGSGQGSTANVNAWDVFRFRTGTTAGTFATADRIMSIGGGLQFYYTGQTFQNYTVPNSGTTLPVKTGVNVSELGLSTGGPSGSSNDGGDGRQSSHWKADEQSGLFVGLMDPTISSGRKEVATDNDYAMLDLIGWDLSATGTAVIPPPPPAPPAPSNDSFTNAPVLSNCAGNTNGTNVGATKEAGEPNDPSSPGSTRSVWYQWTPTSTNSVTIDTRGSGYDTTLAVFTGGAVNALTLVPGAFNDDTDDTATPESETSSVVTFNAVAGTTYRIYVNGYANSSGGDFGTFKLNWNQTGCTGTPPGGGGTTVSFNATNGQFFENDPLGYMAIQVSRSSTAGTASVDYTTSDGSGLTPCQTNTNASASDRCDYATAVGTLRFAAGEQTKTIQIPLINDVYVEPAQTFALTLRNPQGMTITGPTVINLTIVDDDAAAGTVNPIAGTEFFIKEQYIDFLGRVADPGGFNFWLGRMTIPGNCVGQAEPCDRIDTAKRFFESDEFKERGFYIFKLYDGVLGRAPQYSEFVPDVARLNGFQTPTEQRQSKDAYLADLIAKTEFRNIYSAHVNADGTLVAGHATAFVDALITRAQVTLPAASRQALINNLTSGARTPALTMEDFILLPEVNGVGTRIYDRAIITMQYFGFLRRNPDAG